MMKSVPRAEVAEHNSKKSAWIIYEDGVYDITTYF